MRALQPHKVSNDDRFLPSSSFPFIVGAGWAAEVEMSNRAGWDKVVKKEKEGGRKRRKKEKEKLDKANEQFWRLKCTGTSGRKNSLPPSYVREKCVVALRTLVHYLDELCPGLA